MTSPVSENQAPFYSVDGYRSLESFVFRMNLIKASFSVDLDASLASFDITAAQWGILKTIADRRGDTAAELARKYGYDPGALTRMLDRLEQKKLIRRDRSLQDRRCVHLTLTDAGAELTKKCIPYLVDLHNELLRGFSRDEFEALMGYLERVLSNAGIALPPPEVIVSQEISA